MDRDGSIPSVSDVGKTPVAGSPADEVSFVLGLLAFTTADPDRLAPAAQAKTAEWLLKLGALGADRDCTSFLAPPGERSVTFEVRVFDQSGSGRTQTGLTAGEALRAAAQAIGVSAERVEVVIEGGTKAQIVVLSSIVGNTAFFDPRADRTARSVKEGPAHRAAPSLPLVAPSAGSPVAEARTGTDLFDAEVGDLGDEDEDADEPDEPRRADEALARMRRRAHLPAPDEPVSVARDGEDALGPPGHEPEGAAKGAGRADRLAKLGEGGFGKSAFGGDLARVARTQAPPRPAADPPSVHIPTVDEIVGGVGDRLAREVPPVLQALDELRAGTAAVRTALADARADIDAQMSRRRDESATEACEVRAVVEDVGARMTYLRQESAADVEKIRVALAEIAAQVASRRAESAADVAGLQAAMDEVGAQMASRRVESAGDVASLQGALAEVAAQVASRRQEAAADVASIQAALAEVAAQMASGRAGSAADVASLEAALADVAAQMASGRAESVADVASLQAALAEVAVQMASGREASAADVASLQAAVLESRGETEALMTRMLDETAADAAVVQAALLLSRGKTEALMTGLLDEFRSDLAGIQAVVVELRTATETFVVQMLEEVRAGVRAAAAHATMQAESQVARVMEEVGVGVARIDSTARQARDRFDLIDAELSASVSYQRLAADEFSALREDVALVAEMRGELEALRTEMIALKRRMPAPARAYETDLRPDQLDGIADGIAARLLKSVEFEAPPNEHQGSTDRGQGRRR